ncbi:MAG: nitrous oxide reductase accessory protein NosL [Flavobacteriales bacterium]
MIRTLILALLVTGPTSCGRSTPSIDFGKAECANCRMNVVDKQFGAALTTQKGRQYVFDDIACMIHFVGTGTVTEEQVASWQVCDHAAPGTLIDATTAFYLHGPAFRSPMRGDMAAFANEHARDQAKTDGVEALDWNAMRKQLAH